MAELLHSTLNGHVTDQGRTRRGSYRKYEAYDLVGIEAGNRIRISTVDPVDKEKKETKYQLTKTVSKEGAAAREGWELTQRKRMIGKRRTVGKGAITLFDRMEGGRPTRTPKVVLRSGLELGMQHPAVPNVIVNMGAIASMSHMRDKRTVGKRLERLRSEASWTVTKLKFMQQGVLVEGD